MAVFILLSATLSFFKPSLTSWVTPYTPIMLGIIMFGMGLTLKKDDLKTVFKKPQYVIIGCLLQFTIMPFLAYALCLIFKLPRDLAISVMLVGSVSGGTASNVITYLSRGNVPLSISMTTVSTFIGVFITPIYIFLFVKSWVEVSIASMSLTIAQIIIVPLLLGVVIKYFFPKAIDKYIKVMPLVSIVVIAFMCSAIIGRSSDILFKSGFIILFIVMIHNLLGIFLSYMLAKLFGVPEKERRSIAIEVGMQNSGLATNLANIHFGPTSALAGAIFTIWHNISGSILATYWRNNEPKDESNDNI